MNIFRISKSFPKEEKYSLTDKIRRSARSVTSNIAEAWANKMYIRHFVSKLSDSLGEEYETEVWLDYSLKCKCIDKETLVFLNRSLAFSPFSLSRFSGLNHVNPHSKYGILKIMLL